MVTSRERETDRQTDRQKESWLVLDFNVPSTAKGHLWRERKRERGRERERKREQNKKKRKKEKGGRRSGSVKRCYLTHLPQLCLAHADCPQQSPW